MKEKVVLHYILTVDLVSGTMRVQVKKAILNYLAIEKLRPHIKEFMMLLLLL